MVLVPLRCLWEKMEATTIRSGVSVVESVLVVSVLVSICGDFGQKQKHWFIDVPGFLRERLPNRTSSMCVITKRMSVLTWDA